MAQQAGWYPDPVDPTRQRWWDGTAWSATVARDGAVATEPLPVAAQPARRTRWRIWLWVVLAVVLVVIIVRFSALMLLVGGALLVVGVFAVARGSLDWARIRSRKSALLVVASAAVLMMASAGAIVATAPAPSEQAASFAASTRERPAGVSTSVPAPSPTRTPVSTTRDEALTEAVPFEKTTTQDGTLAQGQTRVVTNGVPGVRTKTYRVTSVDGKETGRELVSDVVTTAAVAEVTAVGTYVAPAPAPAAPAAPAAGQCDSNYADGCVPIASDVDCAGGDGDGPAYFDGVARVVGRDVYKLDGNHDGLTCNGKR